MADLCIEKIPPEITPPAVPEEGDVTKEDILNALGYEELALSKTDDEGNTVTVYVIGRVV